VPVSWGLHKAGGNSLVRLVLEKSKHALFPNLFTFRNPIYLRFWFVLALIWFATENEIKDLTEVSCKRPKDPKAKVRKDQSSINKFLSIIGSTATPRKKGYQWTMTKIYHRCKLFENWPPYQCLSMDAFSWQLKLWRDRGVKNKRERPPPTKSNLA
jgi:hypothetical protein